MKNRKINLLTAFLFGFLFYFGFLFIGTIDIPFQNNNLVPKAEANIFKPSGVQSSNGGSTGAFGTGFKLPNNFLNFNNPWAPAPPVAPNTSTDKKCQLAIAYGMPCKSPLQYAIDNLAQGFYNLIGTNPGPAVPTNPVNPCTSNQRRYVLSRPKYCNPSSNNKNPSTPARGNPGNGGGTTGGGGSGSGGSGGGSSSGSGGSGSSSSTSGGGGNTGTGGSSNSTAKDDSKCTSKQPVAGVCQSGGSGGASCTIKAPNDGKFEKGLCLSNPSASYMCCVLNAASATDLAKPADSSKPADQNSSATGSNQSTITTTPTPTLIPTPPPAVIENFEVRLQAIGPNANIQNKERKATIKIYNGKSNPAVAVKSIEITLTYDPVSGNFKNSQIDLGELPKGDYQMVLQIEKYLDKQLVAKSGRTTFALEPGGKIGFYEANDMIVGDIAPAPKGDNFINIVDYNALVGCINIAQPSSCPDAKVADLNDDGKVDQLDLSILQASFGKNGFAFESPEFKCEPDPACVTGKSNLQLCSLVCTKKTVRG